jgi:hypothetical protein
LSLRLLSLHALCTEEMMMTDCGKHGFLWPEKLTR